MHSAFRQNILIMDHFPDMFYHYLHKQQAYDECAALAVAHLSVYQGVCLKYTHRHTLSYYIFSEKNNPDQTFMLINKDQQVTRAPFCFQRKLNGKTQSLNKIRFADCVDSQQAWLDGEQTT